MREIIIPLNSLLPITEEEKLQKFERSACEYPKEKNIVTLFEEKVLEVPQSVAVVFNGLKITYEELNEKANQVGHYLRQKGVTNGSLVPLCMERSAEMIIAILGILKAGGAYVPIDPDFPTDRIAYILHDTTAQIVITDANSLSSLPQNKKVEILNYSDCTSLKQQSVSNLGTAILPDDLAYVIYTSGSTGKPKGVMIEHRSLLDHCFGLIESASLDACKSFALFSPLIFDAGHSLIHTSFILGSCLHVLSKATLADGDKLYQYIAGNRIDCIKIVPSLWMSYTDENNIILPGKVMIFGGEAFPLSIFNRLKSDGYKGKVFNHYGPTEATIGKTIHQVDFSKQYAAIPIGKPFSNTHIYILNNDGKRSLIGEPGEIHIAGDGLAREYLNQAELTNAKFISNTISKVPGKRMYKTGDLAKWWPDGNIEYLGRIDEQVKINGHRIELGEIEAAIHQSGMVIQSIVNALPGKNNSKQLVAYTIIQPGFSIDDIKDYLQKQLPGYMIPAQWVLMQHFPLTINGKIDRKNLPDPVDETTENNKDAVAPRNITEVKLHDLWMDLLHLDDVSIQDNFFKLGGQSLVAMRLVTAIRKQLKIEVTVKDIFNYNTIETLAVYINQQVEVDPNLVISVSARPFKIPLSFNQQALWFIHQLNGSRQYHLPTIVQLNGALNVSALSKAFQQLVKRHQALRTIIDIDEENGYGYQHIKDAAEWVLDVKDEGKFNWTSARLNTFISDFINSPFDLAGDFMLKATLIREQTDQYILVMVVHHIASDRWSNNILFRELSNLYNSDICGIDSNLTGLTLQYADYSIWQREYLAGDNLDKDRAYWKEKLENLSPLNLPLDFPGPVNKSIEGGVFRNSLDKKLKDQLRLLATKNDASLFITLLAGFKVLLYKYSGQNDICIGTPVSGRQYEGLEELVGYFVNTLVLRSQVQGGDTFNDLLSQVKEVALQAYDHQGMPFEKLVESVGAERNSSTSPLFQVMFVFQEITIGNQFNLDKLKAERLQEDCYGYSTSKFDLTFIVTEKDDGLDIKIEYSKALFLPSTIARMLGHFETLISFIADSPAEKIGQLPILTIKETQQLLLDFNSAEPQLIPKQNIIDLFKQQVAVTPENIAVYSQSKNITYKELDERSDKFATLLISKGVKAEALVPLCIEKSVEMIVAILGILKAGGAYVPIDPAYPPHQIAFILADALADFVVVSKVSVQLLPATANFEVIEIDGDWEMKDDEMLAAAVEINPEQLAYVIYTSGSTGKPKGVLIEHKSLAASTISRKNYYGYLGGILLVPSFAFDSSVAVIFGSLITGGQLILCTSVEIKEPAIIKKLMPHVQTILCVPSYYRFLLEDGLLEKSGLKSVILAGEKLDENLVAAHCSSTNNVELYNEYGPTEGAVWSTVAGITKEQELISIGKPINTVSIYIADADMQLVPVGVVGELCIGGVQVARGYQQLPELTNEKFLINNFSNATGSRLYKTGDLARWLPDGNIEYLGRQDDQVKINGYRIEISGIEQVLQDCEDISQALILAKNYENNTKKLVAYVVPTGNFNQELYISFLKNRLPEYMVPALWVAMDRFPLTANGKINKKDLPAPGINSAGAVNYIAPVSDFEIEIGKLWQQLLVVDKVGMHDNFFSLGGHSLLAMRLASAIQKKLQIEVPVKSIFDYPTIAVLSQKLQISNGDTFCNAIKQQTRPEKIPLSYSQEGLWFIDQLGGSTQYHIPTIFHLKGKVEIAMLEKAVREIIIRHEVLRTIILEQNGEGYQQVLDTFSWSLNIADMIKYQEHEQQQYINDLVDRPFNLSEDIMLRADLLMLDSNESILVLTQHHIASDGWSAVNVINELSFLYNSLVENKQVTLKALPLQFADFAIWQRANFQGEKWLSKLSYWQEKLHGIHAVDLHTDYPRPLVQSKKGAVANIKIDIELYEQLKQLSKKEETTLFITLLTVFKVLLHRYTGQQDISIGTPVAGRNQQELEKMVGFFINTIVLRNQFDGNVSFKDLLKQVKRTTLEAYDNQEVPFDKVVELALTERDASRSPLFQVMFALQNIRSDYKLNFSGLTVVEEGRHVSGHTTSKFDLTFNVIEIFDGLEISIEYCTDIFKKETILSLAAHFNNLLKAAVITPGESIGRMQMLKKSEIQYLLKEVNNTNQEFSPENIISLFQAQVSKTPAGIALICEDEQITYGELNDKANQLAHHLIYSGIDEEALVPVCIPRSIKLVTAMLAILKAGAAYVPIDPLLPAERINYLLSDINPSFIIAKEGVLNPDENLAVKEILDLEAHVEMFKYYPSHNTSLKIRPGQLAYVIYTSGSTGKPKGVMVEHAGLSNLVNWHKSAFDVNDLSKASAIAGIGFDAFGWEIWPYLSCGASVHLIHDDLRTDLWGLTDYFSKYNITHSFIPTALVPDFITVSKQNQLSIKYLLTGGDKLLDINTSGLNFTLVNNYGPTETTVVATSFELPGSTVNHNPSIGKPISNICVYLLNEQQQLVPPGAIGEVYIGGPGVARGYLNRKGLTNEKFIRNPFTHKAGERLYRSGDLARMLPDGTLEYIGRTDHQVKIRGFRIELGEIENVLMEHDFINQALVLTRQHSNGEKNLVAYLVASAEFEVTELLTRLKKVLPEYMIPSSFVLIKNFPLTVNGKIDQEALPVPDVNVTIASEAPATEMEIELEKIWNNILGRENTGRRTNFFSVGGHSLLAIRIIAAIRRKLGVEVKVNELFINPTIAELGAVLEEKVTGTGFSNKKNECLIPLKLDGNKPPLYIIAGGGGTALKFKSFANLLEDDQPVFVLQPPIDLGDLESFPATVEGIAEKFIDEIMLQNPVGPCALAGHCMGGIIAFEIAKQLQDKGKQVTTLAMFDTIVNEKISSEKMVLNNFKKIFYKLVLKWYFESYLFKHYTKQAAIYKVKTIKSFFKKIRQSLSRNKEDSSLKIFDYSAELYRKACETYELKAQDIPVVLFYAKERYYFTDANQNIRFKKIQLEDKTKKLWHQYASIISIHDIDGDHSDIFEEARGNRFANLLQNHLNRFNYL